MQIVFIYFESLRKILSDDVFNSTFLKQPNFDKIAHLQSMVFSRKLHFLDPMILLYHFEELTLRFQKNIKSLKSDTPNKSYGRSKTPSIHLFAHTSYAYIVL